MGKLQLFPFICSWIWTIEGFFMPTGTRLQSLFSTQRMSSIGKQPLYDNNNDNKPTGSMLISEIIQKRERALLNRDLIELIVRHEAPEKIKLQVLVDVFDSFMAAIKLSDNVSWFNFEKTFAAERVYFQYDGKFWCGTVTCYSAIYENRPVLFTNIKLPNDGFFYANDYLVPNSTDDIIETSEVQDAIENFLAIFPSGLKIGKMVVNYKLHEGRFEIYQWNDDESKCLTIKFEYGTYEHFQNKKQFTRRALSELKEKIEI